MSTDDAYTGDPDTPRVGEADCDHMVRLGWVRSPQSIEVRFDTSRVGVVDVALRTTASVDAVIPAHPEVDWEQLRTMKKGRRSPLTALLPAPADRRVNEDAPPRLLYEGASSSLDRGVTAIPPIESCRWRAWESH
ncbi:hypothetical protein ACWEKM_00195 [Streptomyces sp. NPDC004752]